MKFFFAALSALAAVAVAERPRLLEFSPGGAVSRRSEADVEKLAAGRRTPAVGFFDVTLAGHQVGVDFFFFFFFLKLR
jgi:hypothetical protein